ncbi:DUF899 domain-containing protein [Streptomyces tendae]|uniref:DUF899 domain-containing protein n=1 Tax=Streptomyces tendae TaxID=1932 RepID=UPI0034061567
MNGPQVVTREAWLVARMKLLAQEREAAGVLADVGRARRALPMVRVDKEYVLEGPDGEVRLLDLFAGRGQLIVYHFMFDPAWDAGCKFCSYLVDNIGDLSHLHARNTTVAIVSRAPFTKIAAFRSRMGWNVPWYSAHGSDFNYDFHVTQDEAVAPVEYDYKDRASLLREGGEWQTVGEQAGLSVFVRRADTVFHTYSAYGEGTDLLLGSDNYLDLTPQGRPSPGAKGKWLRHHDRYES